MPKKDDRPNLWRHASAGLESVVTFGLLLGAGLLVDRWLGSLPLWTLLGAAAGFLAGLHRLIRTARDIERNEKSKEKDRIKDEPPPPSGR